MAQRRVNLPFVAAVSVVIVALLCGVLAIKVLAKKDPKQLEIQADEYLQKNPGPDGLRKSCELLQRAATLAPHDMRLRVKYAGRLRELGSDDDQSMVLSNREYASILQEDPTNKDALATVLKRDVEAVEFFGRPEDFNRLKETSERVLKVKEDDPRYADAKDHQEVLELRRKASAYQRVAVVAAWLQNIVTPEPVLEENLKALDGLLKADLAANDPDRINADVPYYLCLGYWKQANEARMLGGADSQDASRKKEKLAFDTFNSAVLKAPDNPELSVRFYQVLRLLSSDTANDDGRRADREAYLSRMFQVLSHARDIVAADQKAKAPKHTNIVSDVYTSYAEFLMRNGDRLAKIPNVKGPVPKALDVLAEWYQLQPEDQEARWRYAARLAIEPGKRLKAIEILEKDVNDKSQESALRPRSRKANELQTYSELCDLLLAEWSSERDHAKKDDLHKQIDDTFQKITERDRDGYISALYRGEIAMTTKAGAEGAIAAIPELERARDIHKQLYPAGREPHEWKLESLLADAYMRGNQTGLAKQQLNNILRYWSDQSGLPARKMLAQLLIKEHDGDGATEQVKVIARLLGPAAKDDKELQQLQSALVAVTDRGLNRKDIAQSIDAMPEATPPEVHQKLAICLLQQRMDDVVRLLEKQRQDKVPWPGPADVDTVRTLVQIYMSQGKKDKAIKVADEGLAKQKDNLALQIVRAQIDGNKDQVIQLTRKAIESVKDPLTRELNFYEFYRAQNDKAQAVKHLDAADKLDPENPKILDLRFQQAVLDNKFDDAEKYIAKLGEKNYDEAHGLIYRYRLAMIRGDVKTAEDVVQEMTETLPQYARSWIYAGDLLQRQRKYSDAVSRYNSALERQSGNVEALRGLVNSYLSMSPPRPDDAMTYIKKGRDLFPGDPWFKEKEVAWLLAYAPDQAIAPREKEAKANPDEIGPQIALYAAYYELGKQKTQKGKYEEAKAPLQKAHDGFAAILAKWPGESDLAYAYFADICTDVGDFTGGEKALKDLAASPKFKGQPKPAMLLAEYYARAGKNDLAEAAYKDALALSHDAPDVRAKLSRFYAAQHKYDQAIAALDTKSTDRATQESLVQVYIEAGRLTDAAQALNKLLAANPKDPMLLVTQGMLHLQETKYAEALQSLDAAAAIDPKNSAAYFYKGMVLMREGPGHLADAIKAFTTARDLVDSNNVSMQIQSRTMLGEAFRANAQSTEAATELGAALALQPNNKDLRMRLINLLGTEAQPQWTDAERYIREAQQMPEFKTDPDWWRVEATMWATRKQDNKALTAIRQALEFAKGQPQRVIPLMQDYVSILTRLERWQQLIDETTELLKNEQVRDSGWWVYQARATAFAKLGRKSEAMGDFDKALAVTARLRNDDATMQVVQSVSNDIGINQAIQRLEEQAKTGDNRWRVIMVDLYLRRNDYARAEAKADEILADAKANKLKPEEIEPAYGIAGLAYMTTGHYQKAQEVYSKLLESKPDDTVALNNLACINMDYLTPPNPTRALTYSTKAMEIMKKQGYVAPDLMDTHGWVLINNGQVDKGISVLQDSLERRPLMEAHYHMGLALLKKNLAPEATVELQKAQTMLDDQKHKGKPVDPKVEAGITEGLSKARAAAKAANAGT